MFSAKNPPPLYFGIPDLKYVGAGIDFYDLDISKQKFHGCIRLELELMHIRVIHQDLGCFDIPLQQDDARQLKFIKNPKA